MANPLSGFEIGHALVVGQRLFPETPRVESRAPGLRERPFLYQRPFRVGRNSSCADLWLSIFVEKDGYVHMNPSDSSNEWHASPDHKHSYLKVRKPIEEMVKIIGDLQVQPPKHRPAEPANSTPH